MRNKVVPPARERLDHCIVPHSGKGLGLFQRDQRIAGATEAEIYEALSLPCIPPEKRLGEAEIRDALRKAAMGSAECDA